MPTARTTVRIDKAIEAADKLAEVLFDLNKAGAPFDVEAKGTPFAVTKAALITLLQGLYGHSTGEVLYRHHVETGDSPSLCADRYGIVAIAR